MSALTPDDVPAEELARHKTIKVRVPIDLHLELHRRKLLHDEDISANVEAALTAYFKGINADAANEAA